MTHKLGNRGEDNVTTVSKYMANPTSLGLAYVFFLLPLKPGWTNKSSSNAVTDSRITELPSVGKPRTSI